MNVSLEERVKQSRRTPQRIIAELIQELRWAHGPLTKSALITLGMFSRESKESYISYLMERGVITFNETPVGRRAGFLLTDFGRATPLDPPEFIDFSYERTGKGKKRTLWQKMSEIASTIHRNNGKATRYLISVAIKSNYNATVMGLNALINEGYVKEMPEKKNGKVQLFYSLTLKGLETFPDTGDCPPKTSRRRSAGEILIQLLDAAQNGVNKTSLRFINASFPGLNGRINFLLEYGLLSCSNGIFWATQQYQTSDKEALPYALDLLLGNKRRSAGLLELTCLIECSEPMPKTSVYLGINASGRTPIEQRELNGLIRKGYVTSFMRGRTLLYQRTQEGELFVKRVHNTFKALDKSVEKAA